MALEIHIAKERHPGRWIFIIILVALFAAAGWFGYKWYTTGEQPPIPIPLQNADASVDESDVTSKQVSDYTVSKSLPRYVSVPSLGVGKTRVQSVKLDANNVLMFPANINDAGWYEKSSHPGSGGVVIINGHAKGVSKDGPFMQLSTLKKGSEIVIERGDGVIFRYGVVENNSMTVDELNSTGVTLMGKPVQADSEGLNIVTTAGNWVPQLGTFDRRILLRAAIID